jgi:uncharacterized protein
VREERLKKEKKCGSGVIDLKNKTLYVENIPFIYDFFKKLLQYSGIYKKWHANALDVQIRHESWKFANLPANFDGFRILQISDLHIDALPELSEIVPALMSKTEFDLCVFTGDFRFEIHCTTERIGDLLKPIIEAANQAEYPALGILGNHDYLEYTLENVADMGLKFLFNESMELQRGEDKILMTGLDDVHYYRTGRLFEQREFIANADFKLLLIHSPEYYREAALYGYDHYLCGHTHGGQLCLPGGIPVIANCRSPRKYNRGRWQYKKLRGYTSLGTGSSGIPLRWNCPPEIVVHHLERNK